MASKSAQVVTGEGDAHGSQPAQDAGQQGLPAGVLHDEDYGAPVDRSGRASDQYR